MAWFDSPTSFRLRELAESGLDVYHHHYYYNINNNNNNIFPKRAAGPPSTSQSPILMTALNTTMDILLSTEKPLPHSGHPNFLNLAGLVCEAVLEVVFVALPGFLVAYTGMFDANSQKFVAELNTMVFTPCLIFTKLASQLNADKLADLVIIPFIFAAQTLVSYVCAQLMARVWGFGGKEKKRQRNFILAMGVFGNSNSLPISLVLSLSKTIAGLHWDKIPGDNDNEVAARGILYLLVFQQLGQLLRWTWGYSVLLKPKEAYEEEERAEGAEEYRAIEEDGERYRDDPDDVIGEMHGRPLRPQQQQRQPKKTPESGCNSSSHTPAVSSLSSSEGDDGREDVPEIIPSTPANGNIIGNEPRNLVNGHARSPSHPQRPNGGLYDRSRSAGHITLFPNFSNSSSSYNHKFSSSSDAAADTPAWKQSLSATLAHILHLYHRTSTTLSTFSSNLFRRLPQPLQHALTTLTYYTHAFLAGVWRQMNPPLWAMLAAILVASIPALQRLFFTRGTLINNSVTSAIAQSGGVAVPLILVVLGANLARSTLPRDQLATTPAEKHEERQLLYAALLSRMLLPILLMAPVLALVAKYVPVSILDDPIFVIVCFLLTGAPSALQLAQICQVNGVFMGAMSSLLTASYVVAIFPSTLLLVLLALEVLEWAEQGV